MSVLDKLKLYSRKPVAVIMAATLATSSVPVQAVVQATPAYAAPQQKADDQVDEVTGGTFDSQTASISLVYDSDAEKAGSYTLTKKDLLNLLEQQQGEALKALFTYTKGGTDQFSQTIDDVVASFPVGDETKDAYTVTETNYKITDIDIKVAAAAGSSIKVDATDDGWTISAAADVTNEALEITVTSISYQYNFKYTHTFMEEVEVEEPDVPETPDGTEPGEGETGEPTDPTDPGSGEETTQPQYEEKSEEVWYPGSSAEDFTVEASGVINAGTLPAPSVTVTAVDYWAGAEDSAGEAEAEGVTVPELTYGEGSQKATVWGNGWANLDYEVTYDGDAEDYFTVDISRERAGSGFNRRYSYVATVTPKRASDEDMTFTVTFKKHWSGREVGAVTVTVPAIQKKQISIGLDEQPFRLQDAQEKTILVDANERVLEAVNEVEDKLGNESLSEDYYASAELGGDFDNQGVADQSPTVTLAPSEENADAFANYTITAPSNVTIKAIQDVAWADSGLALASEHNEASDAIDLTADNADTWVKKIPTASWDGYELAYATPAVPTTADEFASSVALSGGDGIHSVTMYALSSDNVVSQITGVSYRLDTLAPQLNGADVDYDVKHGTFVFGDQRVGVSFSLVDLIKANAEDSKDTLEALQSGVNTGSVTAEYDDGKNGTTLAADLTNDGSEYSFSITGDRDVNTADIRIHASDVAGNVLDTTADDNNGIPTSITKLVAESTGPSMSVSWDSSDATNGKYYNHNRTLTVTITEAFFNYTQQYANDQVIFTVERNGETAMAIHPTDFTHVSGDTYSYTLAFTDDADYVVSSMHVEDIVGHAATGEGDTFTIDKTAPTMQVTFDNNNVANGNYYNAARTATITITEHNFDPNLVNITTTASAGNGGEVGQPAVSGWSSSGDTHTATVTFPGQGVYTLAVDGMDLATNELTPYSCPEFVVDTIEPEITISGVENLTAYADAVSPAVAVHDTNLSDATDIHVEVVGVSPYGESANPFSAAPAFTATDANVEWGNPDEAKPNDNVYTVVVQAVDLAGNTSDEAVTFSVNRFGSTYVISDETGKMLDQYLKHDNTTDVRVTEINPSGLDESKTSVELTRDTSNTTLKADEDYTTDEGTETGWSQYVYTVDRDNYDADGVYRVLFHSQDVAGNISENAMKDKNAEEAGATAEVNFAVDDTAPLASFADLSNAEPYNESSHTAKVTFEDNLMLDHAVVEIDGQEVATFDAEQLANSTTQEFTINESTGERSIKVTVWDAAGNEGEASMDKVVVTTNAFELWRRNTPLFAGTLAVAAVAVAGIAFGIVKKRKKDDEETNA
ncbi:hypothetical protein [Collinsella tanakaei]|uniref:hypothetical protein n=1 Tax=Collinsella tanakaei TaxID=626935 RepID=UPI0025A498E9|nr:hypothetical protein [Collinsella tanakaei]MDM8300113.1 hypothetical protein [Collinsella tanakaei]